MPNTGRARFFSRLPRRPSRHAWPFLVLGSLQPATSAQADDLSEAGLTPSVEYDGEASASLSGGVRRGASSDGNLHLQLKVDGDRLVDTPGLSGWVDLLWINGGQPSKYVGDAQGVSNIAAPPAFRLYEGWLQYNVPAAGVSILGGRYDLNTEFYRSASANLFLNSSFGIGAAFGLSGFAGPSIFPDPSLGVRLAYKPGPDTVLRGAVLDGAPLDRINGSPPAFDPHNGVLLVAEAAFLTRGSPSDPSTSSRTRIGRFSGLPPYDDKIAIGAWHYTASFNDANAAEPPQRRDSESGAYLVLDRLLVEQNVLRISAFLQLGIAGQSADRFGGYLGAGFAGTGIFASRPADELGIAAAVARNGSHYIAGQQRAGLPVSGSEAAIELTYLAQLAPWLALQPDLQHVIHPNTDPRIANATVLQLRFAMTF